MIYSNKPSLADPTSMRSPPFPALRPVEKTSPPPYFPGPVSGSWCLTFWKFWSWLPTAAPSTPSQQKRSLKKTPSKETLFFKKASLSPAGLFFQTLQKMLPWRNLAGFVEPYVLSSKWPCHVKPTTSSGLLQADPKTTTRPLFLESKPGFLPPNLPLCPKFLNNETVSHCHP